MPKLLGFELVNTNFDQILRHRPVFLFQERFVLQIERHVVDLVKRLLRGFSLPDIGDEIANNIIHSLISDFSLARQLLPQSLLNLPQLHLVMVISLLEGSRGVGIVRVRVLPELADEGDALLALSAIPPERNQVARDDGSI